MTLTKCSKIVLSNRARLASKLNVIFSRFYPGSSGPGKDDESTKTLDNMGAAREDEYFYNQRMEQLQKLKEKLKKRDREQSQPQK